MISNNLSTVICISIAECLIDDPKSIFAMPSVCRNWRDGLNTNASIRIWRQVFYTQPSYQYEYELHRQREMKDPDTIEGSKSLFRRRVTIGENIKVGNCHEVNSIDLPIQSPVAKFIGTNTLLITADDTNTLRVHCRNSGKEISTIGFDTDYVIQNLFALTDNTFITQTQESIIYWQCIDKLEKLCTFPLRRGIVNNFIKYGNHVFCGFISTVPGTFFNTSLLIISLKERTFFQLPTDYAVFTIKSGYLHAIDKYRVVKKISINELLANLNKPEKFYIEYGRIVDTPFQLRPWGNKLFLISKERNGKSKYQIISEKPNFSVLTQETVNLSGILEVFWIQNYPIYICPKTIEASHLMGKDAFKSFLSIFNRLEAFRYPVYDYMGDGTLMMVQNKVDRCTVHIFSYAPMS